MICYCFPWIVILNSVIHNTCCVFLMVDFLHTCLVLGPGGLFSSELATCVVDMLSGMCFFFVNSIINYVFLSVGFLLMFFFDFLFLLDYDLKDMMYLVFSPSNLHIFLLP